MSTELKAIERTDRARSRLEGENIQEHEFRLIGFMINPRANLDSRQGQGPKN